MPKLLVLYVFHTYHERVQHFIDHCIFYDEHVDFMMISNSKDTVFTVPDYVKICRRDNVGYDFGGWSEALLTNHLYEKYDYFIFVNSSVIGPFIPSYYKGKWTDIYIDGLQNNVKLFGSTINTCAEPLHRPHVQSYIFSIDKDTLRYLIQCDIFSMTNAVHTWGEAVANKEILMSTKIIQNNWNIGSLLPHYKDVDFTFKNKRPEEYNITYLEDIMWAQFRNKLWNEYQLVFVKGNRNVL